MQHNNLYNPIAREQEKQRARVQDDCDLRSGSISRQELNKRNGLFSSIDMSRASLRRR